MALKKNLTLEETQARAEASKAKKLATTQAWRAKNLEATKEYNRQYLDKKKAELAADQAARQAYLEAERVYRAARWADPEIDARRKAKQKELYQKRKEAQAADPTLRAEAAARIAANTAKLTLEEKETRKLAKQEWSRKYHITKTPEEREEGRKSNRKSRKHKMLTDPAFRAAKRVRDMVRTAILRGKSTAKTSKTAEYLGCSAKEAAEHIAHLFTPGMSWSNHGEWHIDHIRPCASFDYSDPNWAFEANHYTNLQPLWAADNLAKSDKWEPNNTNV